MTRRMAWNLSGSMRIHEEMCLLSQALSDNECEHVFLPRPEMRHHWQTGWVEEGLQAMLDPGGLWGAMGLALSI